MQQVPILFQPEIPANSEKIFEVTTIRDNVNVAAIEIVVENEGLPF